MEEGFNRAALAYGLPVRLHDRLMNTYVYEAIVPYSSSSEATITQADPWQEKLTAAMLSLDDLWANQWLPEINHQRRNLIHEQRETKEQLPLLPNR